MSAPGAVPDRLDMSGNDGPMGSHARPRELQDFLNNRLYHPLASRLAKRLVPTPVTPNMVSVISALCVLGATIAYTRPGWPLPALAGLFLHMAWHVFDGADGDLARMTGRSGPMGEMVDGICDYVSHIVLYVSLGALLVSQIGPVAWPLMIAAGISRIVQANHYEVQRRQYQCWVYGVPWLRTTSEQRLRGKGIVAALRSAYLALATRMAPKDSGIDAALAAAGNEPQRMDAIRSAIKPRFAVLLPRLGLLSANHRTIVLGISMLAGSPVYYFLYETVLLNLVLMRSIRGCATAIARIDTQMDQGEARTVR